MNARSLCLASNFVVLVLSEAVLSEAVLSEAVLGEAVLGEAVLSEAVLVLDGCLNYGDADRGSRRFSVTCGPMDRIAILDRTRAPRC
jgi:uncharacterized protein YjbI with pentapeptide repeats